MNRETVERLLVSEYRGLLALLQRKARDPHLAADLLNDALVVTLNNFDSGKIADPTHICGYVFQVAMNLLRNHRRSFVENSSKRAPIPEDMLADTAATDVSESDLAERARLLLEELPSPRDRSLLKRFYLNEEDKDSICQSQNMTPLQFDKIIFRARKRMLSLLQSRGFRKGDLLCFAFGLALA